MKGENGMSETKKPEEKVVPKPRKVEKPLNPLAQKPGQNYGTTKFEKEPPYNPDLRK